MNQPVAETLKGLLTTHVATSGWSIQIGVMPETPARVIMISDTGGLPANPKFLLDFPTAQVMIRGEVGGYLATHAEGIAVKDLVLGAPSQDIAGDRYVSFLMQSDLTYLGVDENQYPLFSLNFSFIIEPAASAETNRISL